jgi:hypothetical protein
MMNIKFKLSLDKLADGKQPVYRPIILTLRPRLELRTLAGDITIL